jgi:hypothetical protein
MSKAVDYIKQTDEHRGVQVSMVLDIDGKLLGSRDLNSLCKKSYRVREIYMVLCAFLL